MNSITVKIIILLLLIVFIPGFAGRAAAESAVKCHCFKERSFNPTSPFASDSYILATSFNSLLANYFSIPKKQIIMIRMKDGVGQDDLLISLKLSRISGEETGAFLGLRKQNKSWADIVSGLAQEEKYQDNLLLQAIRSGMGIEQAGRRIADDMISDFYAVSFDTLYSLRKSGLNEKEMALALILVHIRGVKPESLVNLSRKQGKSWSKIAFELGIQPAEAGKYILAYPDKVISE